MRKLKTSDIPALCRGLKQLGIKEKIKAVAQQADNLADAWEKGFDLIWELFDIATESGGEGVIYEFLARPFEMTPEEVENLDLDILLANCQTLARENNLGAFFKSAAQLMK